MSNPGEGVFYARSGLHRTHPGIDAVAHPAVPVGHVNRSPLHPADDWADARGGRGVDESAIGKAKEEFDSLLLQNSGYGGFSIHVFPTPSFESCGL